MASLPSAAPNGPDVATRRETRIERTIERGDTTYELFVGPCNCCDLLVYRLMRACGASSLSVYQISADDAANLENYVDELHASFAVDVETKLLRPRQAIHELIPAGFLKPRKLPLFKCVCSTKRD